MNARYILLIQRQFDEELSERETYELQGFLAGNEAASKLCENMRRLLEESENLDLPDYLKPADAENLLKEIISAIAKNESSWFARVKKFVQNKASTSKPSITHEDELAVLRKHKAAAEHRSSKAMDALRHKLIAEVAPVTSHDAISLAEAIKRRMLEPTPAAAHSASTIPMAAELTPSITESMDQLFSSSNWPVVNLKSTAIETSPTELPEFRPLNTPPPINAILKNRLTQQQQEHTPRLEDRQTGAGGRDNRVGLGDDDEPVAAFPEFPHGNKAQSAQNPLVDEWSAFTSGDPEKMQPIWEMQPETEVPVPVWQMELEAQVSAPEPVWQTEPPPLQPVSDIVDKAKSAPVPHEVLKPSALIPVDDIIAHVSQIFADASDRPEDPLGFSSGPYPKISEIDLNKARAARLATTDNTSESSGRIKGLGKFLLDEQSEAAIGNLSSSNRNLSHARILSDEEALALQECLSPIESIQGVAGCIVLGYDGMIVMNTLPAHADQDALSAWALLTYMNTHELIRVVGHTKLRQFVSRTFSGYLLLADFGQGLLLAVSDNASREAILPLMKSIRKVTAA